MESWIPEHFIDTKYGAVPLHKCEQPSKVATSVVVVDVAIKKMMSGVTQGNT